jgi:hypothetical protein
MLFRSLRAERRSNVFAALPALVAAGAGVKVLEPGISGDIL